MPFPDHMFPPAHFLRRKVETSRNQAKYYQLLEHAVNTQCHNYILGNILQNSESKTSFLYQFSDHYFLTPNVICDQPGKLHQMLFNTQLYLKTIECDHSSAIKI